MRVCCCNLAKIRKREGKKRGGEKESKREGAGGVASYFSDVESAHG